MIKNNDNDEKSYDIDNNTNDKIIIIIIIRMLMIILMTIVMMIMLMPVRGDSRTGTGVCEKTFLLREPWPCNPAAETAIQPQIRCFHS